MHERSVGKLLHALDFSSISVRPLHPQCDLEALEALKKTSPSWHAPRSRCSLTGLFSDLLVHHMGSLLADDIVQGAAEPDEFRTTPLWGVGQLLFFLHDGRTNDLLVAIKGHFSTKTESFPPSEANAVVSNFMRLLPPDQQAILDFRRSL